MTELSTAAAHEEVSLLLPWYVNKTLSEDERNLVSRHLDQCGECRRDVELLGRVQAEVLQGSPAALVQEPQVDRFMQQIDSRSGSPGGEWGWRAAAGAVLLLAVVFSLAQVYWPKTVDPVVYETATATDAATRMNYVLRVRFVAETSIERRQKVFESMGAKAGFEATSPNVYEVVVSLSATTLPELESFAESVRELPDVESVDPVALHLPVERTD